jgi:hypothetical protein
MRIASPVLLSCLATLAVAVPDVARAEKLRSAFDARMHVKPPLMRGENGSDGELQIDSDFIERADHWRQTQPHLAPAVGEARRVGEILVLQGDDATTNTDGMGNYGISLPNVARRAIKELGDTFHFITVWMTYLDRATPMAAAYELTIKNEVQGIAVAVRDTSAQFGSTGTLRSMLNMKRFGMRAGESKQSWGDPIEVWGQESSHRWIIFMRFIDRRTGRPSDALLGRDCAHYSRFVESQGSIQDGVWWKDNGDGSFSVVDTTERYGNLDLYGMGLLAADEVPPFFIIEEIPSWKHPGCGIPYKMMTRPSAARIMGKRLDLSIEDIIAAHGERKPSADDSQNYWREANVLVTLPTEDINGAMVSALAERIDRGRRMTWRRSATSSVLRRGSATNSGLPSVPARKTPSRKIACQWGLSRKSDETRCTTVTAPERPSCSPIFTTPPDRAPRRSHGSPCCRAEPRPHR